jgi:WD40 repeat protein
MTGDDGDDLFAPRSGRAGAQPGGHGTPGDGTPVDDLEGRLRLALRSDPAQAVDLNRVIRQGRARGTQLRRRRQALTAVGTALAVAVVAGAVSLATLRLSGLSGSPAPRTPGGSPARTGRRPRPRRRPGRRPPRHRSRRPRRPPWPRRRPGGVDQPTVPGARGMPRSIAVSADGHRLAISSDADPSRSRPSVVRIFDLADPSAPALQARIDLPGETWAESVALSPDGSVLVAGLDGGAIRLYDLTDPAAPRLAQTLPSTTVYITSVVFSPDGRLLATGGYDDTLRLWRMTGPRATAAGAFRHQAGDLMSLAFDRAGTRLAAASYRRVTVWRLGDDGSGPVTAEVLAEVPASTLGQIDVAFSADLLLVADGDVRVWDLAAPGGPRQQARLRGVGVSLAVSPDGSRFATQRFFLKPDDYVDANVVLWSLPADGRALVRQRVVSTPIGEPGDDRGLAWLPDGRALFATTSNGGADLVDAG